MHRSSICILVLFHTILLVWSCASPVEQSPSSTTAKPEKAAFDHKSSRDSVDWQTLSPDGKTPEVGETDLEWPGERLGLIGPIIASGGSGSRQFIAVYDPAGILVGILTRKAYKKDPSQLADLLARAHLRSKIQNLATMVHYVNLQAGTKSPAPAKP